MGKQEKLYGVVIEDSSITFVIKPHNTEPSRPTLIYDGKDHAMLHRKRGSSVILDFLPEEIRPILQLSSKVKIIESDGVNTYHKYFARVRMLDCMPINQNNIEPEIFS